MSEIYPALVPLQDAQGNLIPDANGAPQYSVAMEGGVPITTMDMGAPHAILITTNGLFNVPGWNAGPAAKLSVVMSRYIGIGSWGYKHFPYPVTPPWHAEFETISPAQTNKFVSTPPITRFISYDAPTFAPLAPNPYIQAPPLAQQQAGWAANPWNDPALYAAWRAAGSPQTLVADFHASSPNDATNVIEMGLAIAGAVLVTLVTAGAGAPLLVTAAVGATGATSIASPQTVTSVGHAVEKAGQQVISEIQRIPSNIADYIANPRDFFQAVAADLEAGWGAPLLLFLGPFGVAALTAMEAGADAHNLHDFAAAFLRAEAGGTAISFAAATVGMTGFFNGATSDGGYSNISPLSNPVVNGVIVPNSVVKDAAKAAAYINGIIPFFPAAIEDLAVLAQKTSQERLDLEAKLQELQAQIMKNSPAWYVAASNAVQVVEAIASVVNPLEWPMLPLMLAETLATASTTLLQMVSAHQTLIDVKAVTEQQQAAAEAASQAELAAIQKQIDAINAQIAAKQKNTSTSQAASAPNTMIYAGIAAALGFAFVLSRRA